jgi:flagellar biogenesis protein FliO
MIEIIAVIISVFIAIAIVVYATWLLMRHLKKGDSKYQSFKEWVKHIFEAIWGL